MCATVQTSLLSCFSLPNAAAVRSFPIHNANKGLTMSLGTILLIVLILALVGVLPTWPHSSSWGYGPSGLVGLLVVVVIILFVLGKL